MIATNESVKERLAKIDKLLLVADADKKKAIKDKETYAASDSAAAKKIETYNQDLILLNQQLD